MDLGLSGKTVLVTGSTAGIGFGTARKFAEEGARVYVNGRTEARVQQAIAAIQRELTSADVHAAPGDVSTAEGVNAVIRVLPQVDVLVNNAGIFEIKPFVEISDQDWLRFFETNVLSGVRLARQYLPGMLQRNWGRIIFVSSESGLQIPSEMIHYGMTKTAQLGVARGLAELTRGTHVTVNSVLPGPTRSEGVGGFVRSMAEQKQQTEADVERDFFSSVRPSSLIARFADTAEVANMIVYAASAAASATNGASLRVDGGVVRSIA